MPITFYHHSQSPPSQMAWMVLRELNLDHEIVELDLWSGTDASAKDVIRKVNPYGKVPAVKDGGVCLGESRAIAIYLCSKYEDKNKAHKLYPTDVESVARINMDLFSDMDAITAAQKYLNLHAVFTGKGKGPLPEKFEDLKVHLDVLEKNLSGHAYVAGDHMTIADFSKLNIMGMLDMAEFQSWDDYPRIVAWRERMSQLPYYEECHYNGFQKNATMFKKANEQYGVGQA